jgi:uncharacterized protein
MTTSTTGELGASEYLALTTFRAGGTPVTTPVWSAACAGTLVVWTPGRSAKVRRIRRTPRVTVATCDFSGGHRGPEVPGTARVLARDEQSAALRALTAAYGWRFRWFRLVLQVSRLRRAGGSPVALGITLT